MTAPRAMPRRPWRSLNAFSASPIRVPLDQSGAAAAARWIARSGLREASARVSRVSRVANTNASAFRPRPRRPAQRQELQVGARVGLHRARDVAQHHQPPADDAPPPAGEPDRVAAGAQAAAQRPAHVDPLAVAVPLARGGCAATGSRAQPRHQPVEPASSSGSSASKRLPRSSSSSLASIGHRRLVRAPQLRSPVDAPDRVAADGGAVGPSAPRLPLGRRRRLGLGGRRRTGPAGVRRRARAEHRDEHRVEGAHLARSETNTARAVQYSRRRLTGRPAPAPGRTGGALGGHRHAGVVQPPAERAGDSAGRSSSSVSNPERLGHSRAGPPARSSPAARIDAPGPRRTSAPSPSVRSIAAASSSRDAEQRRAPPASRSPRRSRAASGRRCRASARPRRRPARPASPTRRARAGGRSRPRARGVG